MALSTQEQILIEQRVMNEAKSVGAAYLLWFPGHFGGSSFYLGRTGSGLAQLALLVVGWLTAAIVIGFGFDCAGHLVDRRRILDPGDDRGAEIRSPSVADAVDGRAN